MIKQYGDDDNYRVIDKFYLYVKDPYETMSQYLLKNVKNGLNKP